jgi:phosphohistidine phosphatase
VLRKRGETIDLVLSSDSTRTRETWAGVEEKIDGKPEVRFLRAMFEAPDYVSVLKEHGRQAAAILVVGHNPAMHETALAVAASLEGRDGRKLYSGFPKGALAIFDFDGEWASLAPGRMQLVAFIEPDGQ